MLFFSLAQASSPFTHNIQSASNFDNALTGEFLLDTIPSTLAKANLQESPAIAFDGTNYLVVWQNKTGNQYNIIGCRVSQSGVPIDGSGFTICSASKDQKNPAVAFDGTNYLVVWQDYRSNSNWDIYGCRVTKTGAVLDGTNNNGGIKISKASGDQKTPAIVFGDTSYFVAWDDQRPGFHEIFGSRVSVAGNTLDTLGVRVSFNNTSSNNPSIAFDGTNYLVAWSTMSPDVYCARVSQTAVVLDPAGIGVATASSSQEYPAVAFDGTNYMVVWKDNRANGVYDVYGSRVSTSGSVIDPSGIIISNAANDQTNIDIAYDGTNYFVVWQDDRDFVTSGRNIYGCRVTTNGNLLDASGIAISVVSDTQQYPAMVFGSDNYFLVWQDHRNNATSKRDIFGGRVDTTGLVIDSSGILLSISANNQQYPVVAFDGTNYLAVWMDSRNTYTTNNDIYGIRINSSGKQIDTAFVISKAINSQNMPAIAYGSGYYFVAWEDSRNGGVDIYGTRISPAGVVLDTAGICISNASDDQTDPAVAFGGNQFFVVWEDNRNIATNLTDIYGGRVDTSGSVLDPSGIAISTIIENQYNPCLAYDGTNFMVVWEDQRNLSDFDIFGCRVDANGTPLEPLGITISVDVYNQIDPAIDFDGTNYIVVWSDSRNNIDYNIYASRLSISGSILDPSGVAISMATEDQNLPDVIYNGKDLIIVWCDKRSVTGIDLYGASVDKTSLAVKSTALLVPTQYDDDMYPNMAKGTAQVLLAYYNQTEIVDDKSYNAYRAWGKMLGSIPGWVQNVPMSTLVPGKYVKDGGSMTAVTSHEFGNAIYAFRGYKSNEFWRFDGLWKSLETIPYGVKPTDPTVINKKKIVKGSSLCWDGDSIIYATKGSTREFWAYNLRQDKWTAKAFVPVPKYLKGGTSIAYRNKKVYLLAGGQKTTDLHNFFVYNPAADTTNGLAWDTLAKAPFGIYYKAWKDGSSIVAIRDTIYALKGGDKYNYFWQYSIKDSIWKQKESIPQIHPMFVNKKNKVGDGAAIATDGRNIYAIKGKGKQDFWIYTPMVRADTGVWIPLETIPYGPIGKKGVPKTGAALSYLEGNVFLLKGNKLNEFWQYIPAFDSITKVHPSIINSANSNAMISMLPTLSVAPNPFTRFTKIKYTVPASGKISIKLYNTIGRLIKILVNDNIRAGSYSVDISSAKLAKGIYFIRYKTDTQKLEEKLIVQ